MCFKEGGLEGNGDLSVLIGCEDSGDSIRERREFIPSCLPGDKSSVGGRQLITRPPAFLGQYYNVTRPNMGELF